MRLTLSLLAAAVLVAGLSAQPKKDARPKAKGEPESRYNLDLKTSDIRLGQTIHGPKLAPADLKGKAVLVDYWGVNCGPCLATMPKTAELYSELDDFGLVVIGAHKQSGEADVVRAVALKHGANFPIHTGCTVRGSEDSKGLPHCLLFDHTGKCVFRGLPTQVDPVARKAVGAALVAAAGREKWVPALEPVVKDLNGGKPPAAVLPRVVGLRTSAGQVGEDARALLAAMTAGGQRKLDQAKEKKDAEPLAAFLLIEKVPAAYKGTPLATEANELLARLKGEKAVKAELLARPALEAVKKLDQQLGLGRADPSKPEWQKANKEPLRQLKTKVEQMKKAWPEAKSTQEAVAIAGRYGVELK